MQVTPSVVKDLAHPVNLGQSFLRRNNADISFRAADVQLKLKGKCVALLPGTMSLTRPTIDSRIIKVLDNWNSMGKNPPESNDMLDARIHVVSDQESMDSVSPPLPGLYRADYKRTVHIHDTLRNVKTSKGIEIPAQSSQKIMLKCDSFVPGTSKNNFVYFEGRQSVAALNEADILLHPGIYPRTGNMIAVTASNFGCDTVRVNPNLTVGTVREVKELGEDPAVNVLSHKSQKDLTDLEVEERREYIRKSLKLDENTAISDSHFWIILMP